MATTPLQLAKHLELPIEALKGIIQAHEAFPIRIPKRWLNLIPPKDLNHPLLKQVSPFNKNLNYRLHSKDPLESKLQTPRLDY